MAKRDTGGVPRSFGVPGFSLESILEECRDKAPEETAAPETAETEYLPETEGYSSERADYPAETEYEAEYPDEEAEYPEYEEFDTGAPEYETEPDTAPEETGEPDGRYYEDAPEPEEAAEGEIYDEGFEDDADFYAPPLKRRTSRKPRKKAKSRTSRRKKAERKRALAAYPAAGGAARRGLGASSWGFSPRRRSAGERSLPARPGAGGRNA